MELSIVIPAYNEGRKIERDLLAAREFLQRHQVEGEILVVDDGSQDDTAAAVQAAAIPGVKLLSYGGNRGKGYALRHGMSQGQGRYLMFADAGLCVPYELAMVGLTYLRQGMCEVAIASRRLRGSQRKDQPLYRRLGSKVFSWVVRSWMGLPWHLTDTQCGFKLYRQEVARDLFGRSVTDGFMVDVETLLRAHRSGYRILEFPVLWQNDADTRFSPTRGSARNFRELLAIKLALRRERP